jgi:FKBP-type peptidyl-prolyl cis-trans isomerase
MNVRRSFAAIFFALGCLTLIAGCGDEEDEAKTLNVYTPQGQVVMKYLDLAEGTGSAVKKHDAVLVHYTGWTGGVKFDSSRDSNKAFKLIVGTGEVIKGWDEGIPGMKVGGKRKLFIPAALGYGDKGVPGTPIKPGSKLVFEVEVLKIM